MNGRFAMWLFGIWAAVSPAVCPAAWVASPRSMLLRGTASQSSEYSSPYPATNALDDNASTFTHTGNFTNSWWMLTLPAASPIGRVELVNRADAAPERMGGLTLRIFDGNSNSVASTTVTNPGLGGTWCYEPPAGVTGRYVRVGLENGAKNGGGDYYVTLAEARVFSGANLALGKDCFMMRLTDSLPPVTYGNDNDFSTIVSNTSASVDGFWEVDLGQTYALYGVRPVPNDRQAANLTRATVRLFDERHDSVFSQHLAASNQPDFRIDLGDAYLARYVRVGLEFKERTTVDGNWHLSFKEIQVFGLPASGIGVLDFRASTNRIARGQSVTLSWRVGDVDQIGLYPGFGSVNGLTDTNGFGIVTISPTNSVCYQLVATNAAHVFHKSVTVLVDGEVPPVRIDEFVADNSVSMEDGYGDSPDWIELFNPGTNAVNLAGYGLSDNPAKPLKWTFPSVSLPAHGRLVVFASGNKTPVDPAGFLHADWKLSADGGHVLLSTPAGVPVAGQTVAYPAQMEDLAYARSLDGAWGFQEPTPTNLNRSARYDGWLAAPDFSHKRGFYDAPFALSLVQTNAGTTLYYSLDGTEPATVYAGPIAIADTRTVRARVARAGWKSPRTKTHTCVFLDTVPTSSVMRASIAQNPLYAQRVKDGLRQLPVFSVAVPANMATLDDYFEREASVEVFWPDGSQSSIQSNCGFEQFGGSYQEFAKKSWRLNFRKDFGAGRLDAPLLRGFDLGFSVRDSFNRLELRSGSQDMVARGFYMAARFVDDSMLEMGNLNPHGRWVHLFLNGVYWGQYDLREALDDAFLAGYLGGTKTDYVTVRGNDNVGSSFVTGTPDAIGREAWYRVRDLRTSYAAVRPYLDVQSLVDFMLLWFYGNCESEYRGAGTVAAGSGFKFWMADSDGFLRTSAMGLNTTGSTGPGSLFGSLRTEGHPDFKMLVADRIQRHFFHGGALTPAATSNRLARRMNEIRDSLVGECARWNYRNPDQGSVSTNWGAAATNIYNNLFPGRTAQLFGYLKTAGLYPSFDPPVLNQQGGTITNGFELTFSAATGTIYYTLDGSDPRLPGGGVSPSALVYNAPSSNETLVAAGSSWRYWDRGNLTGTAWRAAGFNDSAWSNGPAQLGYGDGDEATVVGYGPSASDKYVTTYFRRAFVASNPAGFSQLTLQLVRDDGAVVYLNGAEVERDNMPAGEVTATTRAAATVGGSAESQWFSFSLSPSLFAAGTNTLAVEVHQVVSNSTDLSFNLSLSGVRPQGAAAVVLTNNTVVKSRVWTGADWSALNEAAYFLAGREAAAAGNLAITEIHYDPPGYDDDLEFVEIWNAGTNHVVLDGVTLSNAVYFAFPPGLSVAPGQFVLVVENAAAFAAAYQSTNSSWYHPGLSVAGEWAGGLGNDGERLALVASNGVEIAAVDYAADEDWPSRAAGRGSSLELVTPATLPASQPALNEALARPRAWQSSSLYQGSPGRHDTGRWSVVISEVLSHTDLDDDWIELHNRGTETATLSGLWLGDSWDQPLRYQIPPDVELPPGAFTTVAAAQMGFGFSELGSDALLIEAAGTNIARFVDTVDFPAVAREEPFGRHLRNDGVTDFTELLATTKNAANARPRVGPVVVSEIMADPATGRVEYVELVNIGPAPVALFDTNHPGNAWELSGAVEFRFPGGQYIQPGVPVLVCETSPAAFRALYGVDPSVAVYGPWTGRLDNAGESLRLRNPGDPEWDGTVPYYRADRVAYRLGAESWPAATNGASLERLPLEGYGNDPFHWQASAPGGTPGTVSGNRPPVVQVEGTNVVDEGAALSLTVLGQDADVPWQSVSVAAAGPPAGAVFDPATGAFTWTPAEADGPGLLPLRFVATDTSFQPAAVTQTVWITVNEVNQPPRLAALAGFSHPAGLPLDRAVEAVDDDLPAQPLAFSQSGLPTGLGIDPATGRITGAAAAEGTNPVTVVVSDGQSPPLSATNAFTIVFTPPFRLAVQAATNDVRSFGIPTLPGEAYRVEYCDDLFLSDWKPLLHLPSASGYYWQWTDESATNRAMRFYRTLWEESSP